MDLEESIEAGTVQTNVAGFVRMVMAVFHFFEKQGSGHIAVISSIAGTKGLGAAPSYSATKCFQNSYMEALEQQIRMRGLDIRVTDIRPGFVDTPMSSASGSSELETDWFRSNYIEGRHLPLRRVGKPEEIAGVLYFLCGPDATYITGQTLIVDGGLTITF